MREIKFRAWDKKYNKMRYLDMGDSFRFWADGSWTGVNTVYLPGTLTTDHEKATLMQYTGLKDKNGIEIYEGDIITDTEYYGEVLFHDKRYEVGDHSGKLAWCIFDKEKGDYITLGPCNDKYTWKIISNIYENPELMK